ncbi:F0F1 ATP synthase subunit delta [Fenollaria sporofastidiosus]|uniref:F0F1 ATP synthase subunit delta n=1 Tax=Fenollaria sporofastidiosus TaxID=2811778 RepID=UPI001C005AF8|nr:F0F1 ATP synthase subunit delta [Fenollaria sporofastidiosus]
MEELATTLYAKSMFEASKEDDCLKLVYEELNLIKETIDSNPRLMEVFNHPLLSKMRKGNY